MREKKKRLFVVVVQKKNSVPTKMRHKGTHSFVYIWTLVPSTKRPAWHWHINITAKKDVKTQTLSICDFLKLNRRILYIINKPPDSFIWLSMVLIKIKILCVWESPRTSTVLTHALGEWTPAHSWLQSQGLSCGHSSSGLPLKCPPCNSMANSFLKGDPNSTLPWLPQQPVGLNYI